MKDYFADAWAWMTVSGVRIAVILALATVGFRAAKVYSAKLFQLFFLNHEDAEIRKRAQTFSSFFRYLVLFAIVTVSGMMVLSEVGVKIAPILAGAGVVGIAVGFGAQNLVQDIISGFFILVEDQVRVGDVVEIKGKGGLVEKVGLRMILLRDFSGNVHYIRNGHIDIVTNMTKNFSHYVFEIRAPIERDVEEVTALLKEIDEELRSDPSLQGVILRPLEIYAIDGFTDSAFIMKARATTQPIRQWDVAREFNKRLKKKFAERGIRMPLPQMSLSFDSRRMEGMNPIPVTLQGDGKQEERVVVISKESDLGAAKAARG